MHVTQNSNISFHNKVLLENSYIINLCGYISDTLQSCVVAMKTQKAENICYLALYRSLLTLEIE